MEGGCEKFASRLGGRCPRFHARTEYMDPAPIPSSIAHRILPYLPLMSLKLALKLARSKKVEREDEMR